ncbi:MAG: amidohydrolase family protein [Deltaproteobacteria bacterium]|nr:amidohydrolase family protein [Deltaproteobacteria bacterium]
MVVSRLWVSVSFLSIMVAAGCGGTGVLPSDGAVADASVGDGGGGEGLPGGDGGVEPGVERCPNSPMASAEPGVCRVTRPGTGAVLLRATLLLPDKVLGNAHLLIEGKKLACVGCDCSKHPSFAQATVVECPQGVVSPGLINPHDHIGYAQGRPRPTQVRYDHRHEWREGAGPGKPRINVSGNKAKDGDGEKWGELRMLLGGATSIMGSETANGLLRNLDGGDNGGLGVDAANTPTFPLGDSRGEMLTQQCTYPRLPAPDKIKPLRAYVPHIAEGTNQAARNEFLCLSGQQTGGVDVISANTAIIHAVGLTLTDMQGLGRDQGAVVWSPRSNISLYGMTAEVATLHRLGVKISLGTDWTASGSMNVLRELACADSLNQTYYGKYFTDRQLWEMATVNAAATAGVSDRLGVLTEGAFADLAIFDGRKQKSFAAVLRAEIQGVVLVMRGGEVLYGDDALLTDLKADGCDPLDVCQVKKRVCLTKEIGKNLDALKTSVGTSTYELFFCGTPADEPTCKPMRPSSYDGTVSATDSDGDGVPDADDNCPKHFNPPRPVDGAKQTDFDGDKLGDACDPCPLDADPGKCRKAFDPSDRDGDGALNEKDNCPEIANADQKDADLDGIGDLCDLCAKPNPGGTACPLTIKELKDPALKARPGVGTAVKLERVVVVGIRTTKAGNFGYYVREGTAPYEALFIYTDNAKPADQGAQLLKVGDMVSLEGVLDVYSQMDQLKTPSKVTVSGSGDVTPVVVTPEKLQPGSATAEELESQLVQVSTVVVAGMVAAGTSDSFWLTTAGGNCTGTKPTCTKVSDFFFDGGTVNGQPAVTAGQAFTSVVGVINGFKSDHTLDPRSAADLTPAP